MLGTVAHFCNPITAEVETGTFLELLASLAYLASSRLVRDPVKNRKTKTEKGGCHRRNGS